MQYVNTFHLKHASISQLKYHLNESFYTSNNRPIPSLHHGVFINKWNIMTVQTVFGTTDERIRVYFSFSLNSCFCHEIGSKTVQADQYNHNGL